MGHSNVRTIDNNWSQATFCFLIFFWNFSLRFCLLLDGFRLLVGKVPHNISIRSVPQLTLSHLDILVIFFTFVKGFVTFNHVFISDFTFFRIIVIGEDHRRILQITAIVVFVRAYLNCVDCITFFNFMSNAFQFFQVGNFIFFFLFTLNISIYNQNVAIERIWVCYVSNRSNVIFVILDDLLLSCCNVGSWEFLIA